MLASVALDPCTGFANKSRAEKFSDAPARKFFTVNGNHAAHATDGRRCENLVGIRKGNHFFPGRGAGDSKSLTSKDHAFAGDPITASTACAWCEDFPGLDPKDISRRATHDMPEMIQY